MLMKMRLMTSPQRLKRCRSLLEKCRPSLQQAEDLIARTKRSQRCDERGHDKQTKNYQKLKQN